MSQRTVPYTLKGHLLTYVHTHHYIQLLHQQVNDHTQRMNDTADDDLKFAQLEGATAKRQDDMQRGRVEDAIRRHKQVRDSV